MELAKLYTSIVFKVDRDGLTEFRKEMSQLKSSLKEAATSTGSFRNNLVGLNAQLRAFGKNIEPTQLTKFSKRLTTAMGEFVSLYQKNADMQKNTSKWADAFITNIGRLHSAIEGRNQQIRSYSDAIADLAQSFYHLKEASRDIARFRQVPSSAMSPLREATTARKPKGTYAENQYVGYWGRAEGFAKTPLAAMMRPMLPTGMGMFNAVAAGYGLKEIIATGREMKVMEVMLKTVSGDALTFDKNLTFVKATADELGISILDMGASYAKIFMAGKDQFGVEQIQKSYKGAQAYFRLLGMSPEKINLANKAIEQMFNKQSVSAEELKNQLGEHAAGVMNFFAQAAGVSIKDLRNLMQQGKVGMDVVIKATDAMGRFAYSSKDFREQLQRSGAEQERFNNKMRETSQVLMDSGLDRLLSNLFRIFKAAITILKPAIILLGRALGKLADFLEGMIENKNATLAFAASIIFLTSAAVMPTLARWVTIVIVRLIAFKEAMTAARIEALATAGIIGLLAYAYLSLYDSLINGNENWTTTVTEAVEYLMIKTETWINYFIIGLYKLKNLAGEVGEAIYNSLPFVPIRFVGEGIGTGAAMFKEWVDKQPGAAELYTNPYEKPKSSMMNNLNPTNQPIMINMSIDATKLPGASEGDYQKMGIGIGTVLKQQFPSTAGLGLRN